jgi:hypothetical protein
MRAERSHLFGTARTPVGPLRREPTGLSRLWRIVQELNPSGNTVNCGHTIDAVIHRLSGVNPSAVSHNIGLGGSFEQIGTRHGTTFTWNHSLDAIFGIIESGGHGTIGLVGILWGTSASHIVAIGNVDGIVGICEGQDWSSESPPEVVSDTRKANLRYNPTGGETHGLAIVRWGRKDR